MCTKIFETCIQPSVRALGVDANPPVIVAEELLKPYGNRLRPIGLVQFFCGALVMWRSFCQGLCTSTLSNILFTLRVSLLVEKNPWVM